MRAVSDMPQLSGYLNGNYEQLSVKNCSRQLLACNYKSEVSGITDINNILAKWLQMGFALEIK